MGIIIGTDEDLRQVTFNNPYVAVKYHNENYPICQELYPIYEKLSNLKKYKDITFVGVSANENPVAQKLIEKDVFSFMAIYKKGLLIESRTIASEKDIREILDNLLLIMDSASAKA
jgi:hypothetical protein